MEDLRDSQGNLATHDELGLVTYLTGDCKMRGTFDLVQSIWIHNSTSQAEKHHFFARCLGYAMFILKKEIWDDLGTAYVCPTKLQHGFRVGNGSSKLDDPSKPVDKEFTCR